MPYSSIYGRGPLASALAVELEEQVEMDVGPVHDVRRLGELLRRMADATDAGNEYHSHRTEVAHCLSVVARTALDQFRAQAKLATSLQGEVANTLRRDGGLLTGGEVDLKRRPAALSDTIRHHGAAYPRSYLGGL